MKYIHGAPLRMTLATGRGTAPKAMYLVLEWEALTCAIRTTEEGDGFLLGGGELSSIVNSAIKGQTDLGEQDYAVEGQNITVMVSGSLRSFSMPKFLLSTEETERKEDRNTPETPPAEAVDIPAPSAAVAESVSAPEAPAPLAA